MDMERAKRKREIMQAQAITAVLAQWAMGHSTMLELATGCGKTRTTINALKLASRSMPTRFRALWLVHRENLIDQTIVEVNKVWPEVGTGAVQGKRDEVGAQFIVATAQTLQNSRRRGAMIRHGVFTHLIVDEAHYGIFFPDRQRKDVVSQIRQACPGISILLLTATPVKANGEDTRWLVDNVAYTCGIQDAVDNWGILVQPKGFEFTVPASLAGIRPSKRTGDYTEQQLSVMNTTNVFEIIFKKWRKHADGRQTLVFTPSIEMAEGLAEYFRHHGVPAIYYHSKMKAKHKEMAMRLYKAGKIRVLVNPASLIEGADLPDTSCIINTRPTQSQGLFTQMIGRGLRLADGKTDCMVLNFAPKDGQSLVTLKSIYDENKRAGFCATKRGKMQIQADSQETAKNAPEGKFEPFEVDYEAVLAQVGELYEQYEIRHGRKPGEFTLKVEPYTHINPIQEARGRLEQSQRPFATLPNLQTPTPPANKRAGGMGNFIKQLFYGE